MGGAAFAALRRRARSSPEPRRFWSFACGRIWGLSRPSAHAPDVSWRLRRPRSSKSRTSNPPAPRRGPTGEPWVPPLQEVDDGVEQDPHDVDEVPVEAGHLEADVLGA